MKICSKCGKKYNNDLDYCITCGSKLQQVSQEEEKFIKENNLSENNSWIGIDLDEKIIAKLGNGYFKNLITDGDISKVNAILTQKRLYLCGKSYDISVSSGTLRSFKVSKVINIEDVTGTGFVYISNIMFILFAILFFIAALITMMSYGNLALIFIFISIALLIAFGINQKSIFRIEYSGGSIGFDVKWLNAQESVIFQKKIYQVKDQRKKELIREALNEKEKL